MESINEVDIKNLIKKSKRIKASLDKSRDEICYSLTKDSVCRDMALEMVDEAISSLKYYLIELEKDLAMK